MKLEAVGGVSLSDLRLKVCGQIDDVDGTERTLLGANTASNTKSFRDEGDSRIRCDLNAQFASPNHRA